MHGELWGEERENALKNEKIVLGEKRSGNNVFNTIYCTVNFLRCCVAVIYQNHKVYNKKQLVFQHDPHYFLCCPIPCLCPKKTPKNCKFCSSLTTIYSILEIISKMLSAIKYHESLDKTFMPLLGPTNLMSSGCFQR